MDVLHLFHAGGFMMYPLLLCSIIVVTIFIERFRFYHANRSNIEKLTKEIPEFLSANDQEGLKAALQPMAASLPVSFWKGLSSSPAKRIRPPFWKARHPMPQAS